MSSRCRLFHVDAFTRTRFCGNPARVVLDADDLSDAQMQTIATECNGETAFVLSPASGDHDVQIRFFTPHQEVPFVGHATIAAHYVLAKSGVRSTGVSKQRSRAGIGEIEVTKADGDYRISLSRARRRWVPSFPSITARECWMHWVSPARVCTRSVPCRFSPKAARDS